MKGKFLPICKKDMEERGITQFDFVYIIGDAYVDHPSFGHALISRLLEAHGYTVGIISQIGSRKKAYPFTASHGLRSWSAVEIWIPW